MMYKNTFKLLFSNFHVVWKLLLYLIFVLAITVVIAYFSCLPIVNELSAGGFFEGIKIAYNNFLMSTSLMELIFDITILSELFAAIIVANISHLLFFIILFFFTIIIFFTFIKNFYVFALDNYLYMYMSNGVSVSFTKSFFENFGKNVIYQLLYLITVLPLNLLVYYLMFLSLGLFVGAQTVLAPFVAIAILTLFNALIIALFSCWVPNIVIKDNSVCKSLIAGFKVSLKRFTKTFSNAVCLVLTVIFLNVFVGVFTFGAGLLITIPVSYMLYGTFNMVSFYTSTGMRFYVDPSNVVAPKKMELTDAFCKLKNII